MAGEEQLMELFERTPDLVCIVNKAGWFVKLNQAAIQTLGYTEQELLSTPVFELIHPDDRERTSERRRELLKSKPLLNFQNRYITKNGEVVWLEWTSIYVPENELVFAIAKNITSGKKLELEIENNFKKYKDLTSHFKQNVEKDRRFFATELHEELAQLAAAIKMELDWIYAGSSDLQPLYKERLMHAMNMSQSMIDRIRRLSFSIDPSEIRILGLASALNCLCDEFTLFTSIPCKYIHSFDESHLDEEVGLDMFRICQEALLNVTQHACATEVVVRIEEKNETIILSVTDNGKGFDQTTEQRFGLKNMKGRAASINGELAVETNLEKGTRVAISVKLSS